MALARSTCSYWLETKSEKIDVGRYALTKKERGFN